MQCSALNRPCPCQEAEALKGVLEVSEAHKRMRSLLCLCLVVVALGLFPSSGALGARDRTAPQSEGQGGARVSPRR